MLKPVNSISLVRETFGGALDVAVSRSLLEAVSSGTLGPHLRIHVPSRVVAFGRADRIEQGYESAVAASSAHGFEAVERLAGGRAAVFHENTIAFSLALPDPEPRAHIKERFEMISTAMKNAFQALAIDAHVGEIAGEYCPGAWSVNVGGKTKVMGVGQRLVRKAAHIGGVVVVDDGEAIREVLIPVYRSLGLDWDPRTAGALADRSPGLTIEQVVRSIEDSLADHFVLVESELPAQVVQRGHELLPEHLPRVA